MSHVLEVHNLKKTFQQNGQPVRAVDDVSFFVAPGECLGLVGESGCGKSTTASLILRLLDADEGEILFQEKEGQPLKNILTLKGRSLSSYYQSAQMVFQTPQDSFDPRHTLGDGIKESMINAGMSHTEADDRMRNLLDMVELSSELSKRYPHEVSGGQCQRAAIARALAVNPKLLICDEATSALDVTVQAQIVNLLNRLKKELNLSILLICHDLALVQHMCDRVLVMYQGKIVEEGTPDEVIRNPKEDYTKLLIQSAAL